MGLTAQLHLLPNASPGMATQKTCKSRLKTYMLSTEEISSLIRTFLSFKSKKNWTVFCLEANFDLKK